MDGGDGVHLPIHGALGESLAVGRLLLRKEDPLQGDQRVEQQLWRGADDVEAGDDPKRNLLAHEVGTPEGEKRNALSKQDRC